MATLEPQMGLVAVQRPAAAEKRYGPQSITPVRDSAGRYRFEDSLIVATFVAVSDRILFDILNKTNTPIQIRWSEAAFVDPKGQSQPVMHAGIRYTDCAAPKAPSVLVGGGRITDAAIPCNYVRFDSQWIVDSYIGLPARTNAATASIYAAELSTQYKGKSVRLLLPIKNQDFVSDYTFTFELMSVVVGHSELRP